MFKGDGEVVDRGVLKMLETESQIINKISVSELIQKNFLG